MKVSKLQRIFWKTPTYLKEDSSRKYSAWKDFRFKSLSFQFPPMDRVKCGRLE